VNQVLPQIDEVRKARARRSHLKFMQYTWQGGEEFLVGLHTREICQKIDEALIKFRKGESSFIKIKVHPRSGKSDIVSRYAQPHFIGEFPDYEMMNVCYNSSLAESFALDAMKVMNSLEYQALYPHIRLDQESVKTWSIQKYNPVLKKFESARGKSNASGLFAGITGKGYHFGVLDDYCSSRADAESKTMREKMWSAFTNDFLSRRAPVSITIILATQWHEDDIHGRIEKKNDPESEEYDPKFPAFETLSFPARAEMYHTPSDYPGEYLFLERFSKEFYEAQYATLTPYESSALYDCSPIPKGGAILKTDKINYYADFQVQEWPEGLKWMRVWDMAHTAKQRTGSDPDYTAGTLLAYRKGERNAIGEYQWHLYIKNYVKFRENATQRDNKIIEIAKADGNGVKIIIENSLDAKDAAYYLQDRLSGIRTVHPINCKGDKVTRCSPIESLFEYGRVHVAKGEWNKTWAEELLRFDGSGKSHDEAIDNITCGWIASQDTGYKPMNISIG
jgi:predicted phage terminase large subunit-like protein